MTEITRFDGNVEPFAKDAVSTERTVFGDTAQSDLLDDNINADFFRGWGIVGVNDLPTKQDFNGLGFSSTALAAYIYQRGIPEYNASQEFFEGSITFEDGLLYKAAQDNTGNLPSDDAGTNWNEFLGFTTYDAVTTYHTASIVRKVATYELYASLADGNIGNALPAQVDDANWKYLGSLDDLTGDTGGVFENNKTVLAHRVASGLQGGSIAANTWTTRPLNTVLQNDNGADVALSSNQITLTAGRYIIELVSNAYDVDGTVSRLQNITDGTTIESGITTYANSSANNDTRTFIDADFTLAGTKVLEVQHYSRTANAVSAFGVAAATGENETYAFMKIWKVS